MSKINAPTKLLGQAKSHHSLWLD